VGQISNSPCPFENTREVARREVELIGDLFEELVALIIQLAEAADMPVDVVERRLR